MPKKTSKYAALHGQKFNSLTAIEFIKKTKNGHYLWTFQCKCGAENGVPAHLVCNNLVKSCGRCGDHSFTGVCKKGHDVSKWGRTPAGTCKACVRDKGLMANYGLTWQEYLALFDFQKGRCAICGVILEILAPGKEGWHEGSRIEVDHKHGTNLPKRETVRGLLCGGRWAGCNRKIGRLDNVEWLQNVLRYVSDPPAQKLLVTNDVEVGSPSSRRETGKASSVFTTVQGEIP